MISPYRVYSDLPIFNGSRAWIEINTAAIRQNYRALCDFAKKNGTNAAVSGVIKAEGYGHGAHALTEVLLAEGCRFFCCASGEEAVTIRKLCDQSGVDADILVLGYTPAENVSELLKYRIIQNVFSLDYAKALSEKACALGGTVAVHVKINTGMNRLGFAANDEAEIDASVKDITELSKFAGIAIKGAFTHFARADEQTEAGEAHTRCQAEKFYKTVERLKERGVTFEKLHLCGSAATLIYPEYHADVCRVGIILYGLGVPSGADISLEGALKLKASVAQVNTLFAGEELGYGGAYRAKGREHIATLGIGYADGFLRAYSGCRAVIHSANGDLIGEGRVVGNVCMDQCFVSVGDLDVKCGDIVTLMGEGTQIADLAKKLGTVENEIVTILSARLPRFIYEK